LGGSRRGDRIVGSEYGDRITGRRGNDVLTGNGGRDCLGGGRGDDGLIANDGRRDKLDCGPGRHDRAVVDRRDRTKGCEIIRRRAAS
jgi:Ca2+-binding RTX toxin-like protein